MIKIEQKYLDGLASKGYIPLYAGLVGSHLSGLYNEKSDVDVSVVYLVPPSLRLSLNPKIVDVMPQTFMGEHEYNSMSLQRFLNRYYIGNPTAVEIVFSRPLYVNEAYESILRINKMKSFVHGVPSFVHSCAGQVEKYLSSISGNTFVDPKKCAMHMKHLMLGMVLKNDGRLKSFNYWDLCNAALYTDTLFDEAVYDEFIDAGHAKQMCEKYYIQQYVVEFMQSQCKILRDVNGSGYVTPDYDSLERIYKSVMAHSIASSSSFLIEF